MIRSAATESNDVVDFHLRVDVAARGADAAVENNSHISERYFADGENAGAAVVVGSSADRPSSFGIVFSPLGFSLGEFLSMFFAVFSHHKAVSLAIVLLPFLGALFCPTGIVLVGITFLVALTLSLGIFLSLMSLLFLDFHRIGGAVRNTVEPFLLTVLVTPSLLIGAVLLGIGQSPCLRANARTQYLGRWLTRYTTVHNSILQFRGLGTSPIHAV